MKKIGAVVEVKAEWVDKYCELHKNVWPEVLAIITNSNIQNYSIFLRELNGLGYYLFSYFEYIGENYENDMKAIADNLITQKWWAECKPCLRPLKGIKIEECWAGMEKVFDM